jgi:hypothetical protein
MKKPGNLISLLAVLLMLVTGCNIGVSQPNEKTTSSASHNISGPEGKDVNFAEGLFSRMTMAFCRDSMAK